LIRVTINTRYTEIEAARDHRGRLVFEKGAFTKVVDGALMVCDREGIALATIAPGIWFYVEYE
jgi:hypothetical protein